jgi:hypothetical protein
LIARFISEKYFARYLNDFAFLFDRIRREKGELDLRLRQDSFNLYYKGNSLAMVKVDKVPYQIRVNSKFAHEGFGRIADTNGDSDYRTYTVPPDRLHSFFSKTNLHKSYAAIKRVNYSEELSLEQMLITDSLDRGDLLVIDRQVQAKGLAGSRLDLLALRQVPGEVSRYRFLIIEIKLGSNPELNGKVGMQLARYKNDFETYFDEFKICYERTYRQMKQTRVFSIPTMDTIEIVRPVDTLVVVFGYSGIADIALKALRAEYPEIHVIQWRLTIPGLEK